MELQKFPHQNPYNIVKYIVGLYCWPSDSEIFSGRLVNLLNLLTVDMFGALLKET